jgi:hypothetical protein
MGLTCKQRGLIKFALEKIAAAVAVALAGASFAEELWRWFWSP